MPIFTSVQNDIEKFGPERLGKKKKDTKDFKIGKVVKLFLIAEE